MNLGYELIPTLTYAFLRALQKPQLELLVVARVAAQRLNGSCPTLGDTIPQWDTADNPTDLPEVKEPLPPGRESGVYAGGAAWGVWGKLGDSLKRQRRISSPERSCA